MALSPQPCMIGWNSEAQTGGHKLCKIALGCAAPRPQSTRTKALVVALLSGIILRRLAAHSRAHSHRFGQRRQNMPWAHMHGERLFNNLLPRHLKSCSRTHA
eukprot:352096-Chlamydomonas_euryale.AAC.3